MSSCQFYWCLSCYYSVIFNTVHMQSLIMTLCFYHICNISYCPSIIICIVFLSSFELSFSEIWYCPFKYWSSGIFNIFFLSSYQMDKKISHLPINRLKLLTVYCNTQAEQTSMTKVVVEAQCGICPAPCEVIFIF